MPAKNWTEPLVRELAASHESGDARQAVEDYARSLLQAAKQSSLPINVELIASVKGVKRREGRFDFAGRIYAEEDGQLVMDLNTAHNLNRKRFTCAHELMHTAFPDFAEEKRYRLDNTVEPNPINREEEYLCDLGAASLLMPAELVAGRYSIERGLKSVERLSSHAEVSLEAAGNRMVELAEERVAFMVFEYCHKPAERPALRRGEKVPKQVRLRYARCAGIDAFLPRFKGALEGGAIARAYSSRSTESDVEPLPGAPGAGEFQVEARCYGVDDRQRVLAVARPV